MAYMTIGNTIVEWNDNEPLIFGMSEETGSKDDIRSKTYKFDLTSLREGFEEEFLVNLKNHMIERRNRVSLRTIERELKDFILLFRRIINNSLFVTRRSIIDETFLLSMNTLIEKFPSSSLECLKRNFRYYPRSPIFAHGLRDDDFPIKPNKKGHYGRRISNILAKALTRTASVEILCRCEEAFEDAIIDIGHFSFINLAFSVFVRPESYRRIKLADLVHDITTDTYWLYIAPAKSLVHHPRKICYRINKNVGMLLLKQRQHVVDNCGHLVANADIGKLALFPARLMREDKSGWISEEANKFFGELRCGSFSGTYFRPIRELLGNGKYTVNATSLRHTIGTQLAQAGCSAKTIQAVLKHADDKTCMAYVDITFHGLVNELSDAMKPAFEAPLPVFEKFRSKDDGVKRGKAIYSENLVTGQIELTGECRKDIRCQAAPLVCYECKKFTPCFNADHSINLDIIEYEINLYTSCGTPYRHLVEKAKSIKYRILLVMAACDRYQQSVAEQGGCHEHSH